LSAYIVDSSVAIKWVVTETGTEEALALANNQLLAPALFRAECANILWKKVRKKEISATEASIAAQTMNSFGIELCSLEPDLTRVLELALTLDHPAYDCVYLALAEALDLPLVTADERLIRRVGTASQPGGVLERITVLPLYHAPPSTEELSRHSSG